VDGELGGCGVIGDGEYGRSLGLGLLLVSYRVRARYITVRTSDPFDQ